MAMGNTIKIPLRNVDADMFQDLQADFGKSIAPILQDLCVGATNQGRAEAWVA